MGPSVDCVWKKKGMIVEVLGIPVLWSVVGASLCQQLFTESQFEPLHCVNSKSNFRRLVIGRLHAPELSSSAQPHGINLRERPELAYRQSCLARWSLARIQRR